MTLIEVILNVSHNLRVGNSLFVFMDGIWKQDFFLCCIRNFSLVDFEKARGRKRYQEKIEQDTIQKLERIPHNRRAVSEDCLSAILLDDNSKTFYYLKREDVESNFKKKSYSFDEIYECAISC